ncbi:hypothetical protein [Streptomyces sp. SID14515]|uniref:hypothetical protein n=1 Tax=Streptomyces sp. SID14515 TaxID=2706074 RepID=UPI0013C68C5B|nr:hypothetical protein [Streptomyces sp. SID14515]NEB41723.1 hypothetical protein [Streptomyces sp. SID14515]
MISEPEIVGEYEADAPAEVVSGFDRKPAAGRRRGQGLLWGLGGALVASVVWAAAVFAYGFGDGKPDVRGYGLGEQPCAAMKLKALSGSVGKVEHEPTEQPGRVEHPAVDRVDCAVSLAPFEVSGKKRADRGSAQMSVTMRVELHKEADPGPEFEALSTKLDLFGNEVAKVEGIVGLGDSAYLVTLDDGSSQVSVRDGGAVITIGMSVSMAYDGEDPPEGEVEAPELTPYQGDLISDAHDVLDALKA